MLRSNKDHHSDHRLLKWQSLNLISSHSKRRRVVFNVHIKYINNNCVSIGRTWYKFYKWYWKQAKYKNVQQKVFKFPSFLQVHIFSKPKFWIYRLDKYLFFLNQVNVIHPKTKKGTRILMKDTINNYVNIIISWKILIRYSVSKTISEVVTNYSLLCLFFSVDNPSFSDILYEYLLH